MTSLAISRASLIQQAVSSSESTFLTSAGRSSARKMISMSRPGVVTLPRSRTGSMRMWCVGGPWLTHLPTVSGIHWCQVLMVVVLSSEYVFRTTRMRLFW